MTTESVQDIVGAMVAGAGGSYNDAAGTIVLPTGGGGLDTESVQDIVGAMVATAGGTYDDTAGTITLPSGGGTVTTEQIITAVGVVNGTGATSAQVAAWEAAGIIVLSTDPTINDTTAPTWSATLTATPDAESAVITASSAPSDDINVTAFESSFDGTTWAAAVPSGLDFTFANLARDTEYTLLLRAKDAAGNVSTPALSVTFSTTGTLAPITDSFNRADSVTNLGTTDTGQPWLPLVGTSGIASNMARAYSNSARAGVDLGIANMSVSVDYVAAASYVGLFVRWVDKDNYIFVDTQTGSEFRLYKVIAGTLSVVGGVNPSNVGSGKRLTLEAFDDGTKTIVRRYVDGVLIATDWISDANRPHGTIGGLSLGGNSQTARFDNFELKEITA